jgi:hypothetical protein
MEYSGIWRGGDDAYALWTRATWDEFQAKWNQLSAQGHRKGWAICDRCRDKYTLKGGAKWIPVKS